jgi:ribosomal-protein-alanine N-acetyltransferase
MNGPTLWTARLVLRRWGNEDRAPLAAITADPEVMRYRFAPLSRRESNRFIDENEVSFANKASVCGPWNEGTMLA